jgi:hypothetical protein
VEVTDILANTLAYYGTAKIPAEKSFMAQAQGHNVATLLTSVIYECS